MQAALFIGVVNSVVVFTVACLLAFFLWRANRKLERLLAIVALAVAMLTCWGLSVSVICPLIDEMTTTQPLAVPSGLTDTPTPSAIATPTATPAGSTHPSPTVTVIPTLPSVLPYPAPGLIGPDDGSKFKGDETILLIWDTPTPLSAGEWYEVQLWRGGWDVPYTVVQRTKEGTWEVERRYYPGHYQWRILIVRGQEDEKEIDLSPPSQTWSFGWVRPVVQPSTKAQPPHGGGRIPPVVKQSPRSTPTPVPLLSATPDITEPSTVAVTFTGTVKDVHDSYSLLGTGVRIDNPITGTLFYTLGKSDQDPLPHQGHYDFADGEIRFVVQIGEDIFDTGLNGDGYITTMDNHPRQGDYAEFRSRTNILLSEDIRLEVSIWMEDSQPNPDAAQSDALPSGFHPADWDRIYLTLTGDRYISYPDYDYKEHQNYSVRADIVSAETSVAPIPVPPTNAPVDLTVYLRGTKQGVATFSGERVNAGQIYAEGGTVYGDVAVQTGSTKYHFDQDPEPVGVEQLPDPYRVEFKFSDSLIAATEGMQPGFNPEKAQFWVGTLNCNSATPPDRPYRIEMTLYAGGEARKHTDISFLVADDPSCGVGPEPCPCCTPRPPGPRGSRP